MFPSIPGSCGFATRQAQKEIRIDDAPVQHQKDLSPRAASQALGSARFRGLLFSRPFRTAASSPSQPVATTKAAASAPSRFFSLPQRTTPSSHCSAVSSPRTTPAGRPASERLAYAMRNYGTERLERSSTMLQRLQEECLCGSRKPELEYPVTVLAAAVARLCEAKGYHSCRQLYDSRNPYLEALVSQSAFMLIACSSSVALATILLTFSPVEPKDHPSLFIAHAYSLAAVKVLSSADCMVLSSAVSWRKAFTMINYLPVLCRLSFQIASHQQDSSWQLGWWVDAIRWLGDINTNYAKST